MTMTQKPESKELSILIKLLKMTTSTHDHEAISAMRLANAQLLKLNTDWDDLLNGKVTLVADPFTAIPDVQASAPSPMRSQAPSRPTAPAAPQPPLYHYDSAEIQSYFDILMFVTLQPNIQTQLNRVELEFTNTSKLCDSSYRLLRTLAQANAPKPKAKRRRNTP